VTWSRKQNFKWANYFLLAIFSLFTWAFADILELFAADLETYLFVVRISYIGISTLPLFWFLFVVSYTGRENWFSPVKIALSSIIPILTLFLIFTSESHQLMRNVIAYDTSGQFSRAQVVFGPWFWVHSANSYFFLLLGAILLIQSAFTTRGLFVFQKILLVVACFFPWVINILFLTGITERDYTPTAFTLLSLALVLSVFRYQMLNLVPIARGIVFENMHDPVIVIDQENRIIDLNPTAKKIGQTGVEEFLGRNFSSVFPDFSNFVDRQLETEGIFEEIGVPNDSPVKFYSIQINPLVGLRREMLGKVIVLRNSTEQRLAKITLQKMNRDLEQRVIERTKELVTELETRKNIEKALRESEERYSLAIQGANDGIWDWNLISGDVFFSPRWKSMLGYRDEEIAPAIDSWFSKVHPDDLGLLQIELSRHLDNVTELFQFNHRVFCKDNSILWVSCRGMAKRGHDGIAYRMSGSLTDISRQKQFEEQILFDAFHDPLTNLPNRAFLMERISHSIQRAKRSSNEQFALIFLDLDRFKNINDSLGHSLGDLLLQKLAIRLKDSLRTIDTVARIGGDEFVILIDSISDNDEVIIIANRIIEALSQAVDLENNDVSINASLGIVVFSDNYENAEGILRDADIAMYEAKRNTFRRYELFNPDMRKKANTKLKLETELRHALQFNEFELFYQPILSVAGASLVSFEALIRWHQRVKGYILPAEFIPIAEETGLIIPIGQWVINEACKQIAIWKKIIPPDKHLTVNINLSTKQFSDPHLCQKVRNCINEYKIEGNNLVLEITESAFIEDRINVIASLNELRGMGVKVHIDDFGTGYSSLSYLHSLPFDALKIDRSFIKQMGIGNDNASIEIIQAIISLGKDLGKNVIAEGVESQHELKILTEMSCGYFQGYLIAKPMNKNDASQFLKEEFNKTISME
jgi:diguanylate cyclase (GGDEF)-like protein/PAS domain S-box-containing protein